MRVLVTDDFDSSDFAGLQNLQSLVLVGNDISPEIFSELDSLTTLELETDVSGIKILSWKTVQHMDMLKTVYWVGNDLGRQSTGRGFTGIENVHTWDLSVYLSDRTWVSPVDGIDHPRSTNLLKPIESGTFDGLTGLRKLKLGEALRGVDCADTCWFYTYCRPPVNVNWLTPIVLDDLISLETLTVCDSLESPQLSDAIADWISAHGIFLWVESPVCEPRAYCHRYKIVSSRHH